MISKHARHIKPCKNKKPNNRDYLAFCFTDLNELRQIKCPDEEDRHLSAGDGVVGTVVAAAASGSDAISHQLLDESCCKGISGDIVEAGADSHGGRSIA